jgi:hypothetical protein
MGTYLFSRINKKIRWSKGKGVSCGIKYFSRYSLNDTRIRGIVLVEGNRREIEKTKLLFDVVAVDRK